MSRVTSWKGGGKVSVGEAASCVGVQVSPSGHTHGSREKRSLGTHPSPSALLRFREPGARAMPPLTGMVDEPVGSLPLSREEHHPLCVAQGQDERALTSALTHPAALTWHGSCKVSRTGQAGTRCERGKRQAFNSAD